MSSTAPIITFPPSFQKQLICCALNVKTNQGRLSSIRVIPCNSARLNIKTVGSIVSLAFFLSFMVAEIEPNVASPQCARRLSIYPSKYQSTYEGLSQGKSK
eukprot:GHVN01042785.1.p1 GENE.GHVN01042785.1~~GHVN01042785.1.p1  ORF type:complete len:101 (+),score=5.90 GHVN01042785.1:70-372(+)